MTTEENKKIDRQLLSVLDRYYKECGNLWADEKDQLSLFKFAEWLRKDNEQK